MRLDGVKSVDDRTCEKTWTARVLMKGGRLPDLAAWKEALREDLGVAFTLRGVEAVIVGEIVERDGRPALKMSGVDEALRLATLREKIQWDPRRKRPERPTREERRAFGTLSAEQKGKSGRIRITGPLTEVPGEKLPVLEVREFAWMP